MERGGIAEVRRCPGDFAFMALAGEGSVLSLSIGRASKSDVGELDMLI